MANIFRVDRTNNKIELGTTGTTINVGSHTASLLLSLDASKNLESVSDLTAWVAGTANQITVTDDTDGTLTLSTPQDIHTGASPTFAGMTIVNAITEFSTDGTMGGNSDSAIPTEKATKLYTDTLRSDLASVSNAKGASLVGLEDSAAQFDATDVEAALSELIVLVTPVEYNPAMSRTAGGDAGGNDASVATIDDADSYDTDEVSATPGFDIQAVFTGVTDFNQVQIHTAYDGNPAHVIRIDLDKTPFNWSSFTTILADIDDSSGDFVFNAITVASAAQYINSGEVRLRFYHSSAGNATHDFFIDYCALWKTGTSVGVTEHGGLSGLLDDDHNPLYLRTDGARTLAGAWDMGSQALTNVNIDSGVITGITDLAVADGGTGQSSAQAAINALSAVSGATNEHVLTKDTATGNAVFKAAAGGANHAILDGSVHSDSVADAVTRGSIIYGNATPKWDELVIGAADTFLGSDGTDLSYRSAGQVMASLSAEAAATFSFNNQDLTAVGSIFLIDGKQIGQSAGPLITFDDTNNFLEINGCKVGIGTTTPRTILTLEGALTLKEQAAADGDTAAYGQFWVKDDAPCIPMFTDDTGGDFKLITDAFVGHDGDGYILRDIDGTPTKVYTKYLTGKLDADTETDVAHGITDANILSVTAACFDDNLAKYVVSEFGQGAFANHGFRIRYGGGNVTFTGVGSFLQGNNYRIRIDYYL